MRVKGGEAVHRRPRRHHNTTRRQFILSALHARISRGTTLSVTTGPEQETTAKVDATKAFSVFVLVLITSLVFGLSHAHAQPLVFVDWSWDSALVHNRIAGFVAEHGFGYEVDY